MTEISALTADEEKFLRPFLPSRPADSSRPFVTLTYGSSLDGMISIQTGARTTLSGKETKSMTHYLRLHHDGIMVGVGTAIADNPSLNCRYPGVTLVQQPQPYVLDFRSRWDRSSSAALKLADEGRGKHPKAVTLEHDVDWRGILQHLKQDGINSIMIEGGATVIRDLLAQPDLVDSVIVTMAPTWLGQSGVSIAPDAKSTAKGPVNAASLKDTVWRQFGQDVVLCGTLQYD